MKKIYTQATIALLPLVASLGLTTPAMAQNTTQSDVSSSSESMEVTTPEANNKPSLLLSEPLLSISHTALQGEPLIVMGTGFQPLTSAHLTLNGALLKTVQMGTQGELSTTIDTTDIDPGILEIEIRDEKTSTLLTRSTVSLIAKEKPLENILTPAPEGISVSEETKPTVDKESEGTPEALVPAEPEKVNPEENVDPEPTEHNALTNGEELISEAPDQIKDPALSGTEEKNTSLPAEPSSTEETVNAPEPNSSTDTQQVAPKISASKDIKIGEIMVVDGEGFSAFTNIEVSIESSGLPPYKVVTDEQGKFSLSINTTNALEGNYQIKATKVA